MSDYFIYYTESNVVCIIIFAIMLLHDMFNVDRQEKQIKYDHALIAFILYFLSDIYWTAVMAGVLPKNVYTASLTNFLNYIIMAAVTYTWLYYVMAVEQVPNRNRTINRIAVLFPFAIVTIVIVVLFIFARNIMLTETLEPSVLFNILQTAVPFIYIATVIVYSVRKSRKEKNLADKRKHIYIGFFPLIVVIGGLVQIALPKIPVFCFSCTILMILFYIQSMESQISVDPLTGLNNRGQLRRFIEQNPVSKEEGIKTFVMMIDVNDFKIINDTYGHSEGDKALIAIADSLKYVVKKENISAFIGRYGGDEFILVIQCENEEVIENMIVSLRNDLDNKSKAHDPSYRISVGIGYDEWLGEDDTIQKCMQRADHKLYEDKEAAKLQVG